MNYKQQKGILFAILAAAFYAISAPLSKLLLESIPVTTMAALLYLGAGLGLAATEGIQKLLGVKKYHSEKPLDRKDLPYTVSMIILDIAAPILLMLGLTMSTAANVSLLNNFEIVATSLIAMYFFKEHISKRLWFGIILVTASCMILSFEDWSSFSLSLGSVFVLLACLCWGVENNCTRMLSSKNPIQIVILKGLFSGIGSLLIALFLGEKVHGYLNVFWALLLGFVAYGVSISFYIYAQRMLGAARTSAYYAIAPFLGVVLSLLIFNEIPGLPFFVALLVMGVGTWLVTIDAKH